MTAPEAPEAEHIRWLRGEVARWKGKGLISADQASRILADYEGTEALVAQTVTQRRLVMVLGTLGAVLIGVGVILFIASNWQALPRFSKFTLVLVATGGAYALGYWLWFSRGYVASGGAVMFLGALLYGAGIFLVGQIFHVQAEPHYGLLVWAAGILPLGYLLPVSAMVALASWLLVAWVGIVTTLGPERYGLSTPLLAIPSLLGAGVALYGAGLLHLRVAHGRHFARSYLAIGAVVCLGAYYVYALLVRYVPSMVTYFVPRLQAALPGALEALILGLPVAAGVILLISTVGLPGRRRESLLEAGLLLALLVTPWVIPWIGVRVRAPGWVWLVAVNLLFFAACLILVLRGVHRRERALVNLGLAFFAIGVATRYVDIIGRYRTTALFFIGGGVLLLGGGWLLERTRRRLLRQIDGVGDEP